MPGGTFTQLGAVIHTERIYWGVSSSPASTEAFIESLSGHRNTWTGGVVSFTVNADSTKKIYVARPTHMGPLVFNTGSIDGGFVLISTGILVINTLGLRLLYDLYESVDPGLGVTTVTVRTGSTPVPVVSPIIVTASGTDVTAGGVSVTAAITCFINFPTTTTTLNVGDTISITGTISVPGSVSVTKTKGSTTTVIGSAIVSGTSWSYSYTLLAGDMGPLTFGAVATDASLSSTGNAPGINVTVFSSVPALWLSGQSNAGNQDGVAGTIDSRVTLTWYNGTTNVGPGPMSLQFGGHSFEMECSADMAVHYNGPILVGKVWADGTSIGNWAPGSGLRTILTNCLQSYAAQCLAANVNKIEFGWCQGEGNATNANSPYLGTYEAETSNLFDHVASTLAAFGISVHFTIIKTNANLVTGTNPSDISASGLAAVRTAQAHIPTTRADATALSFDTVNLAGNLHYGSGETNTCGHIWSANIFTRY